MLGSGELLLGQPPPTRQFHLAPAPTFLSLGVYCCAPSTITLSSPANLSDLGLGCVLPPCFRWTVSKRKSSLGVGLAEDDPLHWEEFFGTTVDMLDGLVRVPCVGLEPGHEYHFRVSLVQRVAGPGEREIVLMTGPVLVESTPELPESAIEEVYQVLHAEFGPVLPGIPQCPSLRDFVVVCQQGGYGPGDKGKFIISSPSWKQLIRAMPTPKACVPAAGVSFHDCFTDARRCIKEYSPAALPRELPLEFLQQLVRSIVQVRNLNRACYKVCKLKAAQETLYEEVASLRNKKLSLPEDEDLEHVEQLRGELVEALLSLEKNLQALTKASENILQRVQLEEVLTLEPRAAARVEEIHQLQEKLAAWLTKCEEYADRQCVKSEQVMSLTETESTILASELRGLEELNSFADALQQWCDQAAADRGKRFPSYSLAEEALGILRRAGSSSGEMSVRTEDVQRVLVQRRSTYFAWLTVREEIRFVLQSLPTLRERWAVEIPMLEHLQVIMAEVTKCCNLCVTTLSHLIARCAQEAFDLLPETRRSLLVEVSDHLSMHEALIRYLQETKEEYASRLVRLTGPKLAKEYQETQRMVDEIRSMLHKVQEEVQELKTYQQVLRDAFLDDTPSGAEELSFSESSLSDSEDSHRVRHRIRDVDNRVTRLYDKLRRENESLKSLVHQVPDHWLCPLSMELMEDPVSTLLGHTYERHAIETWLRRHDTDPMTNSVLPDKMLIPNIALRQTIEAWRRQEGNAVGAHAGLNPAGVPFSQRGSAILPVEHEEGAPLDADV